MWLLLPPGAGAQFGRGTGPSDPQGFFSTSSLDQENETQKKQAGKIQEK